MADNELPEGVAQEQADQLISYAMKHLDERVATCARDLKQEQENFYKTQIQPKLEQAGTFTNEQLTQLKEYTISELDIWFASKYGVQIQNAKAELKVEVEKQLPDMISEALVAKGYSPLDSLFEQGQRQKLNEEEFGKAFDARMGKLITEKYPLFSNTHRHFEENIMPEVLKELSAVKKNIDAKADAYFEKKAGDLAELRENMREYQRGVDIADETKKRIDTLFGIEMKDGQSTVNVPGTIPHQLGIMKTKVEDAENYVDEGLRAQRQHLKKIIGLSRPKPLRTLGYLTAFSIMLAGGYYGVNKYTDFERKRDKTAQVTREDLDKAVEGLKAGLDGKQKAEFESYVKKLEELQRNVQDFNSSLKAYVDLLGNVDKTAKDAKEAKDIREYIAELNKKVASDAALLIDKMEKYQKEWLAQSESEKKARDGKDKELSDVISKIARDIEKYKAGGDTAGLKKELETLYKALDTANKNYDAKLGSALEEFRKFREELKAAKPEVKPEIKPEVKPEAKPKTKEEKMAEMWQKWRQLKAEGKADEAKKAMDEILKAQEEKK